MASMRKAAVAQMYDGYRNPQVPDVSPVDVYARIQRKDPRLVLVDVREPAEQQVSVLPGPTLTRDSWQQSGRTPPVTKEDHDIVCYCTAGLRSGKFAAELRQQGYEAFNLEGSILGWTHEGLPLVELNNREQTTRRVHVFSQRWALQAEGYEPVWHSTPAAASRVAWDVLALAGSYLDPRRWFHRTPAPK